MKFLKRISFQDVLGRNVLSIQAGPYYGTDEDRMVVLCANYDTLEDIPGGCLVGASWVVLNIICGLTKLRGWSNHREGKQRGWCNAT